MNYYVLIYFLAAIAEIAAEINGNSSLRFATKPLLMPVLMLFYFSEVRLSFGAFHKKIMAALFFSWLGDVFLLFVFKSELFFLAGLGSFLVAHIFYALAFLHITDAKAPPLLPKKWWILIPIVAYFILLVNSFFGQVPTEMKIPVAIYSLTIAAMVVMAINRFGRVNEKSFSLVLGGALLFMLSDSIIAVNKFLYMDKLAYAGLFIMLLYIIGQYLIARGASKL